MCCLTPLSNNVSVISWWSKGDAGPNAILYKTCSGLCVLEQSREDSSSARPLYGGTNLEEIGPIGLMPALVVSFIGGGNRG